MANNGNSQQVGQVVQIIGPVVDVEFSDNYLPPIYQALRITSEGFDVPTPAPPNRPIFPPRKNG